MPGEVAVMALVLAALAAERGAELAINRANTRWLATNGAVWLGEDGFELILAAQVTLFGLVIIESLRAPWAGIGWWTWACVVGALAAQALRYWCIATLGRRWSIRVVTIPGAARITRGPYRYFPHPNYVAVMAESVLVPLAFHAWLALALVPALTFAALWRRVRFEEHALGRASTP